MGGAPRYYKHRDRPGTPRQRRFAELVEAVWGSFEASGFTYGSPRVVQDLRRDGWRASVNTVAGIMSDHGWAGRTRPGRRRADLVGRSFVADRRDEVWCGWGSPLPTTSNF